MKTEKILKRSILTAFVVLFTMGIYAQKGMGQADNPKAERGPWFHHQQHDYQGNFLRALDLSDEQIEKLENLRLAHMEKMLAHKNKLDEKEARLNTMSTAKKVDMNAINALIDEIGAEKTQMMKEREAHHQEVRKMLTDEQRIKFDIHRSKREKRGHGFHGRGHGQGKMQCH